MLRRMPELELAEGVASIDRDEWNALVADDSPFLEWEWLASLEDAGCVGPRTGWDARPLVVREGGRLVAAAPLYIKSHSEGEFVFDWGWADAAENAGISYYPKMLVGVPFSPVTGRRLLVAKDEDEDAPAGDRVARLNGIGDRLARNLVVGCGFSGSGFKHSPATGRMLSALALGREDTLPEGFRAGRYVLDRFRNNGP